MRSPSPPRPRLPEQPKTCLYFSGRPCRACRHEVDEPCVRVLAWLDRCDEIAGEWHEERDELQAEWDRMSPWEEA